MRLLIAQTTLTEALQAASYFTPNTTLSNIPPAVRLLAEGNEVYISCGSFDHSFECHLSAEIIETGESLIPYRIFSEVVRRLPPGSLLLSMDQEHGFLSISQGNSSYNLNVLSPESPIPTEGPQSYEYKVQLSSADFRRLVTSTSFAASTDQSREVMTGVSISWENQWLSMAAIDGVRLAYNRIDPGSAPPKELLAVVPAKTLNDVARLAAEKESVELEFSDRKVGFIAGNYKVTSRTLEGKFPAYKEIMKFEQGTKIELDSASFMSALERVSLFSKDPDKAVLIEVQPEKIVLGSRSQEVGSAKEELPATVSGDLMRISFNARYLIEGIKAAGEEKVALILTGPASKALVHAPASEKSNDYRYVLMPLRMQ